MMKVEESRMRIELVFEAPEEKIKEMLLKTREESICKLIEKLVAEAGEKRGIWRESPLKLTYCEAREENEFREMFTKFDYDNWWVVPIR